MRFFQIMKVNIDFKPISFSALKQFFMHEPYNMAYMFSKIFQVYIISVLWFGLALGGNNAFDENKRYSCYSCWTETSNVSEMVGGCWTLDEGDFKIEEECYACTVIHMKKTRDPDDDDPIRYYIERDCLSYPLVGINFTKILLKF